MAGFLYKLRPVVCVARKTERKYLTILMLITFIQTIKGLNFPEEKLDWILMTATAGLCSALFLDLNTWEQFTR